jgi:hypothetical protein
MAWVRLDDQIFMNAKIIDLSKDAKLLYLSGLTLAAAQLTDGYLSTMSVRMAAAAVDVERAAAAELIAAGLWTEGVGGIQIHDYLKYNKTAEQVKAEREANAERQARYRERHNEPTNSVSNGVTTTVSNAPPIPIPNTNTRPSPKPKPVEESGSHEPAANAAWDLFESACEYLGVDVSDAAGTKTKQLAAAKRLLHRYSRNDALGCLAWLMSDEWKRQRGIDLMSVESNIDKWILAARPARVEANAPKKHGMSDAEKQSVLRAADRHLPKASNQ